MFILTLAFLVILAVSQIPADLELIPNQMPQWVLVALLIITAAPGWLAFQSGHPFQAEDKEIEIKSLTPFSGKWIK